ncbi:sigma-54-dependent transcriptional regulator [Sphingomonas morindae]|uniref:DNA-binding transcriptional regulator NtrC n=1 Tax=Sphingomonas morindae TaxID=1541170 RepID=A0ABY4X684_9SPHN|nr:sigma-54 dependent transcriptional regulator [Sphingomonas morindae]USI72384.1 sigma-54 dependent transcriptional regulator [Sphingomonas morindae]
MPRETIRSLLLVGHDAGQRRLVTAIAARAGWRTTVAADAAEAQAHLAAPHGGSIEAVLIDQQEVSESVALVAALRGSAAETPIYTLTSLDRLAVAIEAMRVGATDYLVKPLAPDRLLAALDAAASRNAGEGELRPMAEKLWQPLAMEQIVGETPAFRSAIQIAANAAQARVPVLIEGERGTGREMLAEALHAASPRAQRPLVVLDCGAVPSNVIDSDLFGHERGAFAGAFERKLGRFYEADGGTLFLDEISALPLDTQARLLAAIDSGRIWPLGARGWVEVDVRVIAASRVPLAEEVAAGRFREDLLYRLAGVFVAIPPLRERMEDLPALVHHLLARIAQQPGLRELAIADDALELLAAYDWPGNVRQLQNALFRAAVLSDGDELTTADFPQIAQESFARRRPGRAAAPGARRPGAPQSGVPLYTPEGHLRPLDEIEADVIRLAIAHYRGRMSEVARRLGIGRSTLYRKLGDLGIDSAA